MNEIVIDGVIGSWDIDSADIINQLSDMSGDIIISVNSPGGSVYHGISIFNAIKAYDKGVVTTRITSLAASIASYIVLAGDKIEAYDNTTYMIHNAWLPVMGDYNELRKAADISQGLSSIIAKAYVSKTGISKDEIIKAMEKESFYYGDEILKAGFIDTLISTNDTTDKAEAMSITLEGVKACNNAVYTNEHLAIEAVAKLVLPEVQHQQKVADISAQQKRDRDIQILKRKGN